MSLRVTTAAALAVAICPALPTRAEQPSVTELSLEVSALQTLYYLRVTPEQMHQFRKMADETAERGMARTAPKASEKVRRALAELRDALRRPADDQRLEKLFKQLDQAREAEKPQIDDAVEPTDEARERAPEALRLLAPGQVAAYLGSMADDIADPFQRIREALDKARGLNAEQWKDLRENIAEEVGRLVGGVDPDEAGSVGDRVVQLLIVARGLKDAEFKKQRPELEKAAREIAGEAGPTDVLRHVLEHTLAELLSNPRLAAALDARLK